MKLWIQSTLLTVLVLSYSGCGSTPKPKEETKLDKRLPVVHLTQNGVFADMNAIAFEWQPINDPKVDGIYIYKKKVAVESKKQKLTYYKTIDNRFATHFVDSEVLPSSKYIYLFKTFRDGSESIGSKVDVESLPLLELVTWIHSITGMPRSAKIIWRPHTNQKVKSYKIERKMQGDEKFEEIAVVEGRLNAEFIDEDLDDDSIYYYRVRVETFDELLSNPSRAVKAVTKELPKSVESITATTNLVKKIVISWKPTQIEDFKYYNIYRSSDKDGSYKLFKTTKATNATDKLYSDGKKYFYRVSVVDKDDLESQYNATTVLGMSLDKPKVPTDIEVKLLDGAVELKWQNNDPRVKSYIVERKEKDGWFKYKVKQYKDISTQYFKDTDVEVDQEYKYSVFSLDSNGIISKRSKEIVVDTSLMQQKMKIEDGRTVMTIAPKRVKSVENIAQTTKPTEETVMSIDDLEVEEN